MSTKIVKDIQVTRLLTPEGKETIQLTWNYIVPEVTDITIYNIYRCDSRDGTYEKIDTTVLNNYQDQDSEQIPGLSWWYKITYVSASLGESAIAEATPCSLVTYQDTGLGGGLYYIMGEQVRRMNFALAGVGEPCNIYLRKRVGLRCPDCWNERTKQADDPMCKICVVGDTKISIPLGVKEIKDIKIGDKVLTHTGKYQKVEKLFKREVDEDICKIKTVYGCELSLTKNHPVLVVKKDYLTCYRQGQGTSCTRDKNSCHCDGNINRDITCDKYYKLKIQWVPAGDVVVGDRVLLPITQGNNFQKLNFNRLRLLGYYLAEGALSWRKWKKKKGKKLDGSVSFGFNIKETELVDEVVKLVKEEFNVDCGVYRCRQNGVDTNGVTVESFSQDLVEFLYYHCGKGSKSRNEVKTLSKEIMGLSKEQLLPFLGAYINGDGCQCAGGIDYSTATESLAYQLQILFNRCGMCVIPKKIVSKYTKKDGNFMVIYNSMLRNTDISEIVEFTKYNKVVHKYNQHIVYILDNYILLPVISNETIKFIGTVYNLEVKEDNSYVANNISVHNCFGTGFVGGFTKITGTRVIIEQAEEKIMDSSTGFDVKQSLRARIANLPIISEQDILCKQNNVHYLITSVDPRIVQNYLNEQIFSMEQLDPSFPAYLLE